jgi:hypothetical protein
VSRRWINYPDPLKNNHWKSLIGPPAHDTSASQQNIRCHKHTDTHTINWETSTHQDTIRFFSRGRWVAHKVCVATVGGTVEWTPSCVTPPAPLASATRTLLQLSLSVRGLVQILRPFSWHQPRQKNSTVLKRILGKLISPSEGKFTVRCYVQLFSRLSTRASVPFVRRHVFPSFFNYNASDNM